MSPKFIYFDIDNTILNHSHAETRALKEVYRCYPEFRGVSEKAWIDAYKEINHRLWSDYQSGKIDRQFLQFTRFHGTMSHLGLISERSIEIGAAYMAAYRGFWSWVDGAEEVLAKTAKHFPVGFITNGFQETQRKKIEFLKLERFSDTFIISEEIGVMKPHPNVFEIAAKKAKTEDHDILYVGDSYSSDITGGRNAGWKTAWFTALNGTVQNGETADFIFNRFTMLAGYLKIGK